MLTFLELAHGVDATLYDKVDKVPWPCTDISRGTDAPVVVTCEKNKWTSSTMCILYHYIGISLDYCIIICSVLYYYIYYHIMILSHYHIMILSHYYIMISLYYNYSSCLTGHGLVTIPSVNHGQPMTITWTPSLLITHLPIHFLDQSGVKKTGLRTPLQIYCACHGLPKLRAFYMEENMLYLIHVQHAPNKKRIGLHQRLQIYCACHGFLQGYSHFAWKNIQIHEEPKNRQAHCQPLDSLSTFAAFTFSLLASVFDATRILHEKQIIWDISNIHFEIWHVFCCRKVQIVSSALCLLQPDMSCYHTDDKIWSARKDINRKDIYST